METEGKAVKVRPVSHFVEKVCSPNQALQFFFESERFFTAHAEGRVRLAQMLKRKPCSSFVHGMCKLLDEV